MVLWVNFITITMDWTSHLINLWKLYTTAKSFHPKSCNGQTRCKGGVPFPGGTNCHAKAECSVQDELNASAEITKIYDAKAEFSRVGTRSLPMSYGPRYPTVPYSQLVSSLQRFHCIVDTITVVRNQVEADGTRSNQIERILTWWAAHSIIIVKHKDRTTQLPGTIKRSP